MLNHSLIFTALHFYFVYSVCICSICVMSTNLKPEYGSMVRQSIFELTNGLQSIQLCAESWCVSVCCLYEECLSLSLCLCAFITCEFQQHLLNCTVLSTRSYVNHMDVIKYYERKKKQKLIYWLLVRLVAPVDDKNTS